MEEQKYDFPTETVELPSKGLVYPEDHPFSSGKIEMRYMTAKHEDILTNQNYITDGTVIDRLVKALIVGFDKKQLDEIYDDMIVGDKNALMIAARILGYGKDYEFTYLGKNITVDLTSLDTNELNPELYQPGVNEFNFVLPSREISIKYKLLSNKDEKLIEKEIKGLKKINAESDASLSTRLKYMITEVNGEREESYIRKFVDNQLLARDSRAFRKHIQDTQPDVILKFEYNGNNGIEEGTMPIGINFFWPDA